MTGPEEDGSFAGDIPAEIPPDAEPGAANSVAPAIGRAPGPRGDRAVAAWRAFRRWRRSRPFWGGLLLLLAGLELLAIPLFSVLARSSVKLVVYIGIGGVFGLLIGGLLIACGLLIWFHPAQRVFYSIAAVLLSVASFIATNLGGFFVGMLLGLVGGSLAFAWVPGRRRESGHRRPAGRPDQPPGSLDVVLGDSPAGGGPGRGSTTLAFALAPFLLLGLVAPGHPVKSMQPAGAGIKCIIYIPILCPPPSPSPPASPAPSASASPSSLASPEATPSPSAGATSAAGSPSPTPSPSSTEKASAIKAAAPALTVTGAQFTLVTGSALLVGAAYHGVAQVPTSGGGTVAMMKFTMSSLTLDGSPTLSVTQGGTSAQTSGSSMTFTGNVVLYATKLSGDLLGIPITITPDSPLATILQLLKSVTPLVPLTLTHVTTDQPYISTNSLQVPGLQVSPR